MSRNKQPKRYDVEMGNVNVSKMGYMFENCKVLNVVRLSKYDMLDVDISPYDMNKDSVCVWNDPKVSLSGAWWLA